MSQVQCKCDPLYKLMESCINDILREENKKCGEIWTLASAHEPINHIRLGTHLCLDKDPGARLESNVNLLLSKFRERCIRTHSANIFRNTSKETISVAFTYQFFTRLRTLWRSLLEENEGKILAQMDLNGWFSHAEGHVFQDLQVGIDTGVVVDSVNLPNGKYNSVQINLSGPSVSQAIISWILQRYPRPVDNDDCCRLEHCKISIGATEFPASNGNIPITEYRKYLIAKSLVIALGKSGYFVDPIQHYVLPNEPEFTRSIMLVSEGRDGTKIVQRIQTGLVRVREINVAGEANSYMDISAEHFHNLRLQGVKIMPESNFGKDKLGSDVDLSWIISAANLTTATMNYDLLVKDATADIELLASERKDSSFNNAGMLLIMYNYARILSILKKYSAMVTTNEYPSLPSLERVDFDLLASSEEISLVQLIWQWPQIVERTADFLEQSLNISFLLKSIKELANRFNSFYTSSMVLGPPNAPHNFNKMFARIYLLQAIRQVFEEFLEILQINFNTENIVPFK
ncbi:unnamed protein product [Allacma fusca]|uniref:DALR anticodon binding domain-containing protein n=1 Tax=Allacma fusca TaxID=39272 RepID=A0A8J2JQH4_9HEXA|nr:unnamed protein product [Allacma fusca]